MVSETTVLTIADIVPAQVYPIRAVAAVLGVHCHTLRNWVKAGRAVPVARAGPWGKLRFAGSEVLRLFGPTVPVRTETRAERSRRAKAAAARIDNV